MLIEATLSHVHHKNDTKIKDFYEWAIELILMFPGWATLFNLGADFFLYDTASLPVLRYLVPAFLRLLHDFFHANLKGIKSTTGDITRRVINACLIGLVALGWFTTAPLSAIVSSRMVKGPLACFSPAIGIFSLVVLFFAFYSGTASPFQLFGRGGEERMLVYPVLLWMTAFAGYLMASGRADGQDI